MGIEIPQRCSATGPLLDVQEDQRLRPRALGNLPLLQRIPQLQRVGEKPHGKGNGPFGIQALLLLPSVLEVHIPRIGGPYQELGFSGMRLGCNFLVKMSSTRLEKDMCKKKYSNRVSWSPLRSKNILLFCQNKLK